MRHRRIVKTSLLATVAILLGPWVAFTGVAHANPPSIPPIQYSFYVAPGDTPSTAHTLGCNQANSDGSTGHNSLVILDFGAQASNGAGTYLPSTTYEWSNGTDEFYAANFALGYQSCNHGSQVVTLAVGTNNDGSVTDAALGADWAGVVHAVQANASSSGYVNVNVVGAGDWEAGYGPFAHVAGWVEGGDGTGSGYATNYGIPLYNFGSADGCPQSYGEYQNYLCTGDWYQDSNWLDSWGWTVAFATPEIYYNGCDGYAAQDIQWGMISLEGATYHSEPIQFSGPFTEASSCDPSQDAYIDLYNVINNNPQTAMTPLYLLQIHTS